MHVEIITYILCASLTIAVKPDNDNVRICDSELSRVRVSRDDFNFSFEETCSIIFFFIIYIFLDFEKSIALNKFEYPLMSIAFIRILKRKSVWKISGRGGRGGS